MKKKGKVLRKRGLSKVVTTLIIILLVLVAIGILWASIKNIISRGTDKSALGKLSVDLVIKDVGIGSGNVNVRVRRNPGNGELSGVKFFVSDGIDTEEFEEPTTIGEFGEETFTLDYDGLVREVSIAPILESESGKEFIGNEADSQEFTSEEVVENIDGLVAWWRLEGNANDEIGHHHGTMKGEIDCNVAGRFGGACLFDGDDDFIEVPYSEEFCIEDGFTYSAWIWPETVLGDDKMILGFHLPYLSIGGEGNLVMSLDPMGDQYWVYGESVLERENWYHVVATYDSEGYMKVYVDGEEDGVEEVFKDVTGCDSNLNIGQNNGIHFYEGLIDEVMIFNRALSDEEIMALYELDFSDIG